MTNRSESLLIRKSEKKQSNSKFFESVFFAKYLFITGTKTQLSSTQASQNINKILNGKDHLLSLHIARPSRDVNAPATVIAVYF